jgi:hypothetical protein
VEKRRFTETQIAAILKELDQERVSLQRSTPGNSQLALARFRPTRRLGHASTGITVERYLHVHSD